MSNLTINSLRIYLKQMIDAVSYLHSKGLAHGQISTDHIGGILGKYKLRMSYARLIDDR